MFLPATQSYYSNKLCFFYTISAGDFLLEESRLDRANQFQLFIQSWARLLDRTTIRKCISHACRCCLHSPGQLGLLYAAWKLVNYFKFSKCVFNKKRNHSKRKEKFILNLPFKFHYSLFEKFKRSWECVPGLRTLSHAAGCG